MYESIELTEHEGLVVTPFYNVFDFEVLRPFAKLVAYQLLKVIWVIDAPIGTSNWNFSVDLFVSAVCTVFWLKFDFFQALKVCHDNNIAHRDVKPDNIVFSWNGDKPHIYLTDFGISLHRDDPFATLGRTTGAYMAPEFLFNKWIDEVWETSYDIWGAGLVLTELVSSEYTKIPSKKATFS